MRDGERAARFSTSRGAAAHGVRLALRMLRLKHLRDGSFDACAREVRGSVVYRAGVLPS